MSLPTMPIAPINLSCADFDYDTIVRGYGVGKFANPQRPGKLFVVEGFYEASCEQSAFVAIRFKNLVSHNCRRDLYR